MIYDNKDFPYPIDMTVSIRTFVKKTYILNISSVNVKEELLQKCMKIHQLIADEIRTPTICGTLDMKCMLSVCTRLHIFDHYQI